MQLGRDFNINSISLDSIKVDYEMYGEEKYLRNIASKDVVPDKDFEIAMAVFKEMVIRHCQMQKKRLFYIYMKINRLKKLFSIVTTVTTLLLKRRTKNGYFGISN